MTDTPLPVVISAGEALVDLVRTGPTTWSAHPGGAPWNTARALASLGLGAAFAGSVGNDIFGDDLARATLAGGLDPRFLQRADTPTLIAVVHETHPPAYFFLGENSADLHFDPAALPTGWADAARWAHFGCISLARPPVNARYVAMAEAVKAAGGRVSFDPNARLPHRDPAYRPVFERMLRLADFLKLSDEDARFFFPDRSEDEVVAEVRALNPTVPIVLTRGGDGASLFEAGAARRDFPAVKVNVVDTVGAGDAFVAGAVYGAATRPDAPWAEHVALALKVGAAACTRAGAHAPTLAEVEAL